MTAALKIHRISIEDYLAGELTSPVKYEYVGGVVYAMAGARNAHDLISTNVIVSLGSRLRGGRCRPYNSDTKIRVRLPTQVRFYYPDVSVICRPNPQTDSFQDEPAVIAEVLSRNTRRIDQVEKKDAYLTNPQLSAYLLIGQESPLVTVHRRTESGFVQEFYSDLNGVIPLSEIGTDLPLTEIYDSVEFVPEEEDIGQ